MKAVSVNRAHWLSGPVHVRSTVGADSLDADSYGSGPTLRQRLAIDPASPAERAAAADAAH